MNNGKFVFGCAVGYILITFLIFFTDKALADEFVGNCRYYNPNIKEIVYVKWKNEIAPPSLYDVNGKYILSFDPLEIHFINGCKNSLHFQKLDKNYDEYTVQWWNENIDKNSKYYFKFAGIVSQGKDVFYSGYYEDNKDKDTKISNTKKSIPCSYNLKNGYLWHFS